MKTFNTAIEFLIELSRELRFNDLELHLTDGVDKNEGYKIIVILNLQTNEWQVNGQTGNAVFLLLKATTLCDPVNKNQIVLNEENYNYFIELIKANGKPIPMLEEQFIVGGFYNQSSVLVKVRKGKVIALDQELVEKDINAIRDYLKAADVPVGNWRFCTNDITKIGCLFVSLTQLRLVVDTWDRLNNPDIDSLPKVIGKIDLTK